MGPHLGEQPYTNRIQKAGGEERNGLELWRKLLEEHESGADQHALSSLCRFHRYPQCPTKQHLGHDVAECTFLLNKYGRNIPDINLYTMLLNVLPEDVQNEVRDRKSTLPSTQKVLDDIAGELSRYQDVHLSKVHKRFENTILTSGQPNPVHHVADMAALEEQIGKLKHDLETSIAAVVNGNGKGKGLT